VTAHADLTLARACAEGSPEAWDRFVAEYRPRLYAAARAIAGSDQGRELADSLYADLYGLETRDGQRRSLFTYYQGRSSLMTWLRAVLAQRHVDALRAGARRAYARIGTDGAAEEEVIDPPAPPSDPDPDAPRQAAALRVAVRDAIDALEPDDRLRLAWYYAHDLTLAEIARMSGEHEATVSRKLARTRRRLRDAIETTLRERFKLTEAELGECLGRVQDIDAGTFLATDTRGSSQIKDSR
jgi:RNA polymerase sigma-70 factor (ECF subfamily)